MATRLRVTARCLEEDLGLPRDYACLDAELFESRCEPVRKFVSMRGTDPNSGEPIESLSPRTAFRSLHTGRGRAATFYDKVHDVCWLLAWDPYHADGDPDDVYEYFGRLDSAKVLRPSKEDVDQLVAPAIGAALFRQAEIAGGLLVLNARSEPAKSVCWTLADGVGIRIMLEVVWDERDGLEQGWLGILLEPRQDILAHSLWSIAAALLKGLGEDVLGTLEAVTDGFPDRPSPPNELVITWTAERRR